ncbi:17638_t:CDS:2, partial [Gigaspora rosea]
FTPFTISGLTPRYLRCSKNKDELHGAFGDHKDTDSGEGFGTQKATDSNMNQGTLGCLLLSLLYHKILPHSENRSPG